jgi:mRNA interferase YafQ
MYQRVPQKQFKKDVKRVKKRGWDTEKLKILLKLLIEGSILPLEYKDHALLGNYNGCRDCHIEPDWLLIYRYDGEFLHLIRTGSHSDLFK